jgi:hypothetical protein
MKVLQKIFWEKNNKFCLRSNLSSKTIDSTYRISIKKAGDFHSKNENYEPVNSDMSLHEMTDKLGYLLSLGELPNSNTQEYHKGHLESTMHVAVIFCKPLVKNMITIEFGRRVSILLSQIKKDKLRPDIIAFVGGNENKKNIPGAKAGYIYFRRLSAEAKLDLSGFEFIIEQEVTSFRNNLHNLLITLEKKYGKEVISRCHFTLISSDYHLIRIAEIFKLSRRQSILFPLVKINATWTYLFAAYPFCVSPDPRLAFLGRIRVLANDLAIVLVNLNGLIEFNDLIARENFNRLCETNQKLQKMLRIMPGPDNPFPLANGSIKLSSRQWEVLEHGLCAIHEVQRILTPLMNGESVERRRLIHARDLFMEVVKNIRFSIDPDRPITSNEWVFSLEQAKINNFPKKTKGCL